MANIYRERRHTGTEPLQYVFDDETLRSAAGECAPPMDVYETAEGIEVVMDVPGVAMHDLRIVFSQGTLIVAGRKLPSACPSHQAAFHLAERSFGRFARAIRLAGAFDASQASARLTAGELHVTLGRIEERRGRDIRIPIVDGGEGASIDRR